MDKQQESVHAVYYGSDGAKTRSLLRRLEALGLIGQVAAQLFRAQKYSSRAKVYRGGIWRSSGKRTSYSYLANDRKSKVLDDLCSLLSLSAHDFRWGWKDDSAQRHATHVLCVDLPNGQVSFHSPTRFDGPNYSGDWNRERGSERRIIEFCQYLLDGLPADKGSETKFLCTRNALESSPTERTVE